MMRKWLTMLVFFVIMGSFVHLFAERVIFIGTIPLNGRIELQEVFELEITQNNTITFTPDIAGQAIDIATYDFYSNNADSSYTLRLKPSTFSEFGDATFAFKNVDARGNATGAVSVPFMLSILLPDLQEEDVTPKAEALEKSIGIRDGSRYRENGVIRMTFPSQTEGFQFDVFSAGFYEASITVEVSTD
jgi:hypothetical protein